MRTKYTFNCDICHLKREIGVFQLVLDATLPGPKGKSSKDKLKYTSSILPMTNVTFLGVFHVQ